MSLSKELYKDIYCLLKNKVLQKIESYNLDEEDAYKPFQYALFTKKGYLAKGFIHGVETALGTWHESIAQIIAKNKFKIAKKLKGKDKLKGAVTLSSQTAMSNILSDLDSASREPDHKKEFNEIYSKSKKGKAKERIQTVDLYLEKSNDEEIYFEIKGPKPNKNEMRAAKRDLLEIIAMRAKEGKKVKVFLGMYYNPYYPEQYKRWTVIKFFDLGNDFLVGKSFWDFLGGSGTYEQLIKIYEDVGEEIRPELEKKFERLIKKFRK